MTCEYIRVTYGLHTSTYEWHTDDIRMTCECHTDDMQFERKVRLSFLKLFDNSLSKYLICERIPCMQWLFLIIYLPKLKRCLELAFGAHFLHGFCIQMLFISYSINWQSFNLISFLQDIKQNVLSSYLDNWWRHKLWDLFSIIL